MSPAPLTAAELFRRAAACYLRADDQRAACRCYEDGGAHAEAGRLHERAKRFVVAAEQFERAGAWADAARCRLAADDPRRAAELYLRGGDALTGAWLLADRCGQVERARAVAAAFDARTDADRAAVGLVLGRCDAGAARWADAAGRLQRFGAGLGRLTPTVVLRLLPWAQAIGTVAGRPDLIAETFALAVEARVRGAARLWTIWAMEAFGDASDVPEEPEPPAVPAPRAYHEIRAPAAGRYRYRDRRLPEQQLSVGLQLEPDSYLGSLDEFESSGEPPAPMRLHAGVSGVVTEVLVENEQQVAKGDVLFRVDTTSPPDDAGGVGGPSEPGA